MRYLKAVVVAAIGLGALFGALDGLSPGAGVVWGKGKAKAKEAEKGPPTAEEQRVDLDWGYVQAYIKEYKKAPDRVWVFPVSHAAMMRYAGDVLKWCDGCEERWGYKTGKVYEDTHSKQARLKDMIRQARVYVGNFVAMKADIGKELPQRLASAITVADQDTQNGASTGVTADFDKGRKSLDKAEDIYVLAQAVYGGEDPALAKAAQDIKALEARVTERQKQYWEKTRETLQRPQEEYRAADLEQVRSAVLEGWKAKYPQDKIAAVIVPSNTNSRLMVASYNQAEKTLDLEDVSLLPVRVVVAGEPGWEWIYSATVVKSGRSASPVISADVSEKGKLTSPTDQVKAR